MPAGFWKDVAVMTYARFVVLVLIVSLPMCLTYTRSVVALFQMNTSFNCNFLVSNHSFDYAVSQHRYMRPIATDGVASSACLSVCLSVGNVREPCKNG